MLEHLSEKQEQTEVAFSVLMILLQFAQTQMVQKKAESLQKFPVFLPVYPKMLLILTLALDRSKTSSSIQI